MAKNTTVRQSPETLWMGNYRSLIQRVIYLCNKTATRFAIPNFYGTEINLTAIQLQILEYTLEDRNEKMSYTADRIGITRGAFSNNVKRLEALGLVYKEHRGANKKDFYLVVTDKGTEIYKQYADYIYENALKYIFEIADTIPPVYIKKFEELLEKYADCII